MVFEKETPFCLDFKWYGLPDFRSQSKFRPFANQPLFDPSKSRLVQIPNPGCIYLPRRLKLRWTCCVDDDGKGDASDEPDEG